MYCPMKTCGRREVYLQKYLTLALDGLEWLVPCTTCVNHRARTPPYHWIGGWVGPRNNLNTMEYKRSLATARKQTPIPWSLAHSQLSHGKTKNTNFIKVKYMPYFQILNNYNIQHKNGQHST
jgi:hypothetical protein